MYVCVFAFWKVGGSLIGVFVIYIALLCLCLTLHVVFFMCMFVDRRFKASYKPAALSQCFACGLIIVMPGCRIDELWLNGKKKDRDRVNKSLLTFTS